MISTLRVDRLLESYFTNEAHISFHGALRSWDFQDTDDDNATECYFYFARETNADDLKGYVADIGAFLGVPAEAAAIEPTDWNGGDCVRVAFTVELGDRNGRKFA